MARFSAEAKPGEDLNTRFAQQNEVLASLEPFVKANVDRWFKPTDEKWQPSKYLPDFSKPATLAEEITGLQKRASGLSNALMVVLVGNGITEEGLPLFLARIVSTEATTDQTGTDNTGYAILGRRWTGEEDRHRRFFGLYLPLTGRINTSAYERTVQNYLRNGFNPQIIDPIDTIGYPRNQELGTEIPHSRSSDIARAEGDEVLADGLKAIAKEEGGHGAMYTQILAKVFYVAPELAIISYRDRAFQGLDMPGTKMDDTGDLSPEKRESGIFSRYAAVALRLGIYTPRDFVRIIMSGIKKFNIANLSLTGNAAKAQEELCSKFTIEYGERLNETFLKRTSKLYPNPSFSWIYDQPVFTKQAA